MALIPTLGKYHVALNGVGLLLEKSPDFPAYQQTQAPIFGRRFAQGDRSYDDLSQWWYFAQTDWSGGIRDTQSFVDDATWFLSTNVDTWSQPGKVILSRKPIDEDTPDTTSEDILCGAAGLLLTNSVERYYGTDDDTPGGQPTFNRFNGVAWANAKSFAVANNAVSQIIPRGGYAWSLLFGGAAAEMVTSYDGTTFSDKSANINTALASFTFKSCRTGVDIDGVLYLFVDDNAFNVALMKTSVLNPVAAVDWTKVFNVVNHDNRKILDCAHFDSKIYYLSYSPFENSMDLRYWDIADAIDVFVRRFKNITLKSSRDHGLGGKLLVNHLGSLIVTVPDSSIWKVTTTTISEIFKKDTFKTDTLNEFVSSVSLFLGGVVSDDKIWWAHLMYDGSTFYNTFRDKADATDQFIFPVFVGTDDQLYFVEEDGSGVMQNLKRLNFAQDQDYKGDADENYVIMGNVDNISAIDKVAYSLNIVFDSFASGQSIEIEFSTEEMSSSISWTSLGTASFTLDGGTVTSKTFLFGDGVLFKKLWLRAKLNGGGSNTPGLSDVTMEYLPFKTARKRWNLSVNCADELKRLDGATVETVGRELRGKLEAAWWAQSILDYQDLDYATTQLDGALTASATTVTVDNQGTYNFPEQGRIKVDDEEILYTGKTNTTFTGCTRGARGTTAAAHLDNAVVDNSFKVIVASVSQRLPILLEDKNLEYVVNLELREA